MDLQRGIYNVTSQELQGLVLSRLTAIKPVTQETAIAEAIKTLKEAGAPKEARQMEEWFKRNGAWLVERVNG